MKKLTAIEKANRKEEKAIRKHATRMAKHWIKTVSPAIRKAKKANKPATFMPYLSKTEIAIARNLLAKKGYTLRTVSGHSVMVTKY